MAWHPLFSRFSVLGLSFILRLLGVITLAFLLFQIAPSDPVRLRLGPMASESEVARIRASMGLDRARWQQFAGYLGHALQGDLGVSFRDERQVAPLVLEKMQRTLFIAACALLPVLPLSYLAALALNLWPRRTVPLLGLVKGFSVVPTFLVAIGGILLLSLAGISLHRSTALPAFLLALFPFSALTLLLHAAATASPPSLAWRSALAQGFPRWLAFHRALFRPAVSLWLTAWLTQFSFVIFVAMVVEVILTVDGCGSLLLEAIQRRDLPVVQGILVFNAVIFLILQTLSAFLQPVLDPRCAGSTQPSA